MRISHPPIVGHWYASQTKYADFFEIVAMDDNLIELQFENGEISEIDVETWFALKSQEVAPPTDLTICYELTKEDLENLNLDNYNCQSLNNPINEIDSL